MAASGALIARAAFVGDLAWLAVVSAMAIATLSVLTWHHGQVICEQHEPGIPRRLQTVAFALLTVATVLIAGGRDRGDDSDLALWPRSMATLSRLRSETVTQLRCAALAGFQ